MRRIQQYSGRDVYGAYGGAAPDAEVKQILAKAKHLKKGKDVFPLVSQLLRSGKIDITDPGNSAAKKKGFIADLQAGDMKSLVAKFHILKRFIASKGGTDDLGTVFSWITEKGAKAVQWASSADNRKALSIASGDMSAIRKMRKAAKEAEKAAAAVAKAASQSGAVRKIRDPRTGQVVTAESAAVLQARRRAAAAAAASARADASSELGGVDPKVFLGFGVAAVAAVYLVKR